MKIPESPADRRLRLGTAPRQPSQAYTVPAIEYPPMTPGQFQRWVDEMRVSKTKAAQLLGISRNMPAKYVDGSAEIPLTVGLACTALIRSLKPWPN